MRALTIAIGFTLAACGPAAAPTAEAPAAGETPSSLAEAIPDDGRPAVGSTALVPLSAEMLVGRWGDNGDCAKDIVFAADGSFRSYTGGAGRWSVNGDSITMSGQGGTFELRVQSLNARQLIVGNPDGSFGISQRC